MATRTPRVTRFAILGSGRGSNAVALMKSFLSGAIEADLAVVLSNVPGAAILDRAAEYGFPARLLCCQGMERADQDAVLCDQLSRYAVDHLLLAGYMRVLSPEFLRSFPGHILNIHPSLLPDYPGRRAVADQWQAGVRVTGATVHFVEVGVDTGPILLSGSLEVRGDEGEKGLAERIRTEVEHLIYPRSVQLLLSRIQRSTPLHQEQARLQQMTEKEVIRTATAHSSTDSTWRKRVLVLGSGGREHAMLRALATAPSVELLCAPGNPGTAELATNVPVSLDDIAAVVRVAQRYRIDLVIPGPEAVLALGVTDALSAVGIACCGPSRLAAQLETSKSFTRELTASIQVPGPRFEVVVNLSGLCSALARWAGVPVLKANGLASGKGVFLASSKEECLSIGTNLLEGSLGEAGKTLVLEDRLEGEEASLFYACHGTDCVELPHAQDYKRLCDGNLGPNTGGMGAVSPHPLISDALAQQIRERIVRPTLQQMAARGTPFVGFLFVGLILTAAGPALLEFNVRLGDPEAAVILSRLPDGQFLRLCEATATGQLSDFSLPISARSACAVVLASSEYPQTSKTGTPITIDTVASSTSRAWLLHGGTVFSSSGLRTAGGRVLTVVAEGASPLQARQRAYLGTAAISFTGMQLRRDIGLPTPSSLPRQSSEK